LGEELLYVVRVQRRFGRGDAGKGCHGKMGLWREAYASWTGRIAQEPARTLMWA
jgi:hypothetical protein